MTLSPTLKLFTLEPTDSTIPIPSWPSVVFDGTSGVSPLIICRSVPQIVVLTILIIASVLSVMNGFSLSINFSTPDFS